MDEALENLPAEERIKRLKELKKKREKEISETEVLLKESEGELREQRAWEEKVPIPQVAKEEGDTPEENELIKVHRGNVEDHLEEETEGLAAVVQDAPKDVFDETTQYGSRDEEERTLYQSQEEERPGYGHRELEVKENVRDGDIMERSQRSYRTNLNSEERHMDEFYRS